MKAYFIQFVDILMKVDGFLVTGVILAENEKIFFDKVNLIINKTERIQNDIVERIQSGGKLLHGEQRYREPWQLPGYRGLRLRKPRKLRTSSTVQDLHTNVPSVPVPTTDTSRNERKRTSAGEMKASICTTLRS